MEVHLCGRVDEGDVALEQFTDTYSRLVVDKHHSIDSPQRWTQKRRHITGICRGVCTSRVKNVGVYNVQFVRGKDFPEL
ncbi:hypothetical protein ASG05_01820 [Frigoribacterium sp. Leaf186]|nr:hypothetical protein ASG05_01820 [Frigoribacterium sp. Leaf186]